MRDSEKKKVIRFFKDEHNMTPNSWMCTLICVVVNLAVSLASGLLSIIILHVGVSGLKPTSLSREQFVVQMMIVRCILLIVLAFNLFLSIRMMLRKRRLGGCFTTMSIVFSVLMIIINIAAVIVEARILKDYKPQALIIAAITSDFLSIVFGLFVIFVFYYDHGRMESDVGLADDKL
jgi:hypothetical protein